MKKIICLFLAVMMFICPITANAFVDIDSHEEAITYLNEYDIVQGVSKTEFNPDALVSRWQMALMMARATSGKTDDANWTEGAALFTDCTQYLGAIQYCFTKGIIKGVTATEFAPNNDITLRDGVIMAVRALGYEKEDDGKEASAKKYNVSGPTYWLPYYQKGIEIGLLNELETLSVTKSLTRAECAQLIYNMFCAKVYDGNGYTLEDVAFNGKRVDADSLVGGYIVATPTQYFKGYEATEEDSVIVYIEEYGDITITLEELGITEAENYFGAYVELANFKGEDYDTFEYVSSVDNKNVYFTTNDSVTYMEDNKRIKIGSKTYYIVDEENKNVITFYVPTEEGYVETTIEDKYYDVIFIDTDLDGYYEIGLVDYYNITEYSEPSRKGIETCGVMKGDDEVKYSKTPEEEDVFVYTYNPITKFVSVKGEYKTLEGEITSYRQNVVDEETIIKVTIDGTVYEITTDPEDMYADVKATFDTAENLADFASKNIGSVVEYSVIDDTLCAFGEVIAEEENYNYLVAEFDFVDYKRGEYVTMNAFIDGEEVEIDVKKIYNADKSVKIDCEKNSWNKIVNTFEGNFQVFTYTVNKDGYYILTECNFPYELSQYTNDTKFLTFDDYEEVTATDRDKIIRIDADTKIYVVNNEENVVEIIKPKKSSFSIDVTTDTRFYADKIGYGKEDTNGVASILYISTTGEVYNYAEYDVIYIPEKIKGLEVGSAEEFGFESEDEDAIYSKFDVSENNVYSIKSLKAIDTVYTIERFDSLQPGVYLIDKDGIMIEAIAKANLVNGVNKFNLGFVFYYETLNSNNIDVYYKVKTITTDTFVVDESNNVNTIKFKTLMGRSYSNDTLANYLEKGAVNALIIPNKYSGYVANIGYTNDTVNGLIIND